MRHENVQSTNKEGPTCCSVVCHEYFKNRRVLQEQASSQPHFCVILSLYSLNNYSITVIPVSTVSWFLNVLDNPVPLFTADVNITESSQQREAMAFTTTAPCQRWGSQFGIYWSTKGRGKSQQLTCLSHAYPALLLEQWTKQWVRHCMGGRGRLKITSARTKNCCW